MSTQNVLALKFDTNDLRILTDDNGEPWFVATDVCRILGLENTTKAIQVIDDDCLKTFQVTDALGRTRDTTILNEAGFYTLVLRSNKPEAKKFRKWVTGEVLPSIRKTGTYISTAQQAPALPLTYIEALEHLLESKKENETIKLQLMDMKPKADFCEEYLETDGVITNRIMAKTLGIGHYALVEFLTENDICFRDPGTKALLPYAEYVTRGYASIVHGKTTAGYSFNPYVKWTSEGVKWLTEKYEKEKIKESYPGMFRELSANCRLKNPVHRYICSRLGDGIPVANLPAEISEKFFKKVSPAYVKGVVQILKQKIKDNAASQTSLKLAQ
jgi:anti-repressor protein